MNPTFLTVKRSAVVMSTSQPPPSHPFVKPLGRKRHCQCSSLYNQHIIEPLQRNGTITHHCESHTQPSWIIEILPGLHRPQCSTMTVDWVTRLGAFLSRERRGRSRRRGNSSGGFYIEDSAFGRGCLEIMNDDVWRTVMGDGLFDVMTVARGEEYVYTMR